MTFVGNLLIVLIFGMTISGCVQKGASTLDSPAATAVTDPDVSVSLMLITPQAQTIYLNQNLQFVVTGSEGPFTFTVESGLGTVSAFGLYTAPAVPAIAVVSAENSSGVKAFAVVTVTNPLYVVPAVKILATNETFTYSATGGTPPYTYAIRTGTGSVTSVAGLYTAPAAVGGDVIEVSDSAGNHAYGAITIRPSLSIAPAIVNVAIGQIYIFSATGGTAPYTYSKIAGSGSITSSGTFTAPNVVGTTMLRVTDSSGLTSDATATIVLQPSITPNTKALAINRTATFTVSGGTAPYTFTLLSGTGVLVPGATTATLTAPATEGSAVVRVEDANNFTDDAEVTYFLPKIMGLHTNSCLVNRPDSSSSEIKCWGYNDTYGSLGYEASYVGDNAGEMGDNLPAVSLGTTFVPEQISAHSYGTCVKKTDGRAKCWGILDSLGAGAQTAVQIGGYANQMGNNLLYVSLGVGKTIDTLYSATGSAGYSNCAILSGADAGKVKCWGVNNYSQLGYGNATAGYGLNPLLSGANLPFVNIGTGRTAVELSLSDYFTCAILDAGALGSRVKCWGYNPHGNLGYQDITNRTAPAGDNNLADYVDLGTLNGDGSGGNLYAIKITTNGSYNSCALLNNNKVKCWGQNNQGQLGYGDTTKRGHAASTMGDNLPYVDLGSIGTVVDLKSGDSRTCALFDNDKIKCWGENTTGALGLGHTTQIGDTMAEMGDTLLFVDVGTNLSVVKYSVGGSHTCAILDPSAGGSRLKCWGLNLQAQLGQAHNYNLGGHPVTMGDNLLTVDLGTYDNGDPKVAIEVAAGFSHTCAILDDDSVKCWGFNRTDYGVLGIETTVIGDSPAELAALPLVDVGTNRNVVDIKSSSNVNCVKFDDGNLKCWGYNAYGALGTGDVLNRGDVPVTGAMGDALLDVNLGSGRTVSDFALGLLNTCAVLDSGASSSRLKCWGYNGSGILGLGDAVNRSTSAQLGDNLPYVDLGTVNGNGTGGPLIAAKVSLSRISSYFTCVILTNGRIKCFGYTGTYGMLGRVLADNIGIGDSAAEMGDNLPYLDLGTVNGDGTGGNLLASQIETGSDTTCALLTNGRIKCWGYNGNGELCIGDNLGSKSAIGNEVGEMGDNLAYANLGTVNGDGTGGNLQASKVVVGQSHACALITNGSVKCWGHNSVGTSGYEDGNYRGLSLSTIGDFIPTVDLGTGRTAVDLFAGFYHNCAVLDNNDVKCWGYGLNGQTGYGHRSDIGSRPLTMGDYLPVLVPFRVGD